MNVRYLTRILPIVSLSYMFMAPVAAEDCYRYESALDRLHCEKSKTALERKYDQENNYYILQRYQKQIEREEREQQQAQQQLELRKRQQEAERQRKAEEEAYWNSPQGKAEIERQNRAFVEQVRRQRQIDEEYAQRKEAMKRIRVDAKIDALQRENRIFEIAQKNNRVDEASYVLRIAAIAPDWERMHALVNEANGKFGGRFEMLRGLVLTMGCPEYDFDSRMDDSKTCDEKYNEQGNRIMLDYLPVASAEDQMLICGFMYSQMMSHEHFAVDDIVRYIDNRFEGPWYRRNQARFTRYWEECRQSANKVSEATLKGYINNLNFYTYNINWSTNYANAEKEPKKQAGRWLMFHHPLLQELSDFADANKVQQAVESARIWPEYNIWRGDRRNWALDDAKRDGLRLDWFYPTAEDGDEFDAKAEGRKIKKKEPAWAPDWVALHDAANALIQGQRYEQALVKATEALDFATEKGGVQNDASQVSEHQIGLINFYLGETHYDESIRHFKNAVTIGEALYPDKDDAMTGSDNVSIGALHIRQGKFSEALPYLQKALEIRKKVSGPFTDPAASVYHLQAQSYAGMKKYKEAEDAYLNAMACYEITHGTKNYEARIKVKNELAAMYEKTNRKKEAAALQ
jgi:hypothetical protein